MLCLDNGGTLLASYLEPNKTIEDRLIFPSCPDTKHPSAAFFKINDPIKNFDRIRKLVDAGYMVRTRADAETLEARTNDTARRDRAFASGAQLISTDYPQPNPKFSNYHVAIDRESKIFQRK